MARSEKGNSDPARLERIIADYRQLLADGTAPSVDQLVSRHPDLAEALRGRLTQLRPHAPGEPTSGVPTNRLGPGEQTEHWTPDDGHSSSDDSTFVYEDGSSSSHATPKPGPIQVGAKVGSYRLIRQLGQGGMGVVYEAEHEDSGRRLALKLLSPDLPRTRETIDRFLNEANLAAALSHPRTTFIYEAGEVEGHFFIAMELMPGRTLRDEVQEIGQLPVPQAVDFTLDVLEGLDAAHKAGVVHRDVKPSNCFLDDDGRVKVGDFGLSKSLVAESDLTRTGTFLGTPQFAAPEQFRRAGVDHRTDGFAVGATLYFLLAGKPPFSGDAAAVIAQIVADDPPPLESVNPAVPRSLSRVVERSMRKDPKQRYRDSAEFRRALLPYSSHGTSIADVGRRVAAFFVDGLLLSIVTAFVSTIYLIARMEADAGVPMGMGAGVVAALAWIPYFSISEGIFGCSLGKYWLGLRVFDAFGERPGIWRSLLRALILPGITWLSVDLLQYRYNVVILRSGDDAFASISIWNSAIVPQLFTIAKLGMCLLVCSTMRVGNGFRGIHELISGTRVIRLSSDESSGIRLMLPQFAPAFDESLPSSLGTFQILGRLGSFADTPVLAARDEQLQRPAWICVNQDAKELSPERIRLARAGRQRWLKSGEQQGLFWYALESVDGVPLTDATRFSELPWAAGRKVLLETIEELSAAQADGTVPERLSPDQIWLNPQGHVKLLDQPLLDSNLQPTAALPRGPGDELAPTRRAPDELDPVEIKRFVNSVAFLCSQDDEVPGSALDVVHALNELESPSSLGAMASALRALAVQPYRFRWDDRLGVLAISSGVETVVYGTPALLAAVVMGTQSGLSVTRCSILGAAAGLVIAALIGYWLRGGIAFWLTGTDVRSNAREPASRTRCAWRNVVAWSPIVAFQSVLGLWLIFLSGLVRNIENAPVESLFEWSILSAYLGIFGILQLVGFVTSVLQPRRGLQDLFAGTYLVRH